MLKISCCSDLHHEFQDDMLEIIDQINDLGADLNIIAGDIDPTPEYRHFFRNEVNNSILVKGNHDYYKGYLTDDFRSFERNGISFVTCTLWTSFDNGNPVVENAFRRGMADFNWIKTNHENGLVEHIKEINKSNFEKIMDIQPDIVVTHHCPTLRSIHPRYENDIINYCFSNDYEKYLQDTKIKYWIFGHTHWRHSYKIGNTQFICNPRGYPNEIKQEFKPVIIEI